MDRTLYILTGRTAVGKTALAVDWAEQHDAEIVSCDALLVYRGMDVGTAKPDSRDRARVKHHLIDVCPVREPYNIGLFVQDARQAIEDIHTRGKRVLVAGGSGFYLRSFFGPVADDIRIPSDVRARVSELEATGGAEALRAAFERMNPDLPDGAIDLRNPRRVARALERCLATGLPHVRLRENFSRQASPFVNYTRRLVRIEREDTVLRERISLRAREMIHAGLVEEVRRLGAEGLEENPSAARAIGYRQCLAYIGGEMGACELAGAIAAATWALARKQRTWFRSQLPGHAVLDAESADPGRLFLDSDLIPEGRSTPRPAGSLANAP